MTPKELKVARLSLGLSAHKLAQALGYTSKYAGRNVYRWENGEAKIPVTVAKVVEGMLNGRAT